MALLNIETVDAIRVLTEKYAANEKERYNEEARWESIKFHDPARYAAREAKLFLVKSYNDELGCVAYETFTTSRRALTYIEDVTRSDGPDSSNYCLYYGPDGERIPISVTWEPRIVCDV